MNTHRTDCPACGGSGKRPEKPKPAASLGATNHQPLERASIDIAHS